MLTKSDADNLNSIATIIHDLNRRWWADIAKPLTEIEADEFTSHGEPIIDWENKFYVKLDRNIPEMLCLIHSEISEALEGHRKNLMDDKLPHRKMLEVELADAMIRIFDLCEGLGLDIGGALVEKCKYNVSREDHKIENRLKEGGKRY